MKEYFASSTFRGTKQGYVFTTRNGQTGYYRDRNGEPDVGNSQHGEPVGDNGDNPPAQQALAPRRTNILRRVSNFCESRKNLILWVGCAAAALIILYLVYRWRRRR